MADLREPATIVDKTALAARAAGEMREAGLQVLAQAVNVPRKGRAQVTSEAERLIASAGAVESLLADLAEANERASLLQTERDEARARVVALNGALELPSVDDLVGLPVPPTGPPFTRPITPECAAVILDFIAGFQTVVPIAPAGGEAS